MPEHSITPRPTIMDIRWAVPSSTNPRQTWTVSALFPNSLLRCDCPGFQFRRTCRHVTLVHAGDAPKPRIRVRVPCPPPAARDEG